MRIAETHKSENNAHYYVSKQANLHGEVEQTRYEDTGEAKNTKEKNYEQEVQQGMRNIKTSINGSKLA